MVSTRLAGIAGAAYSLSVNLAWSEGRTLGNGWIPLAIVIFEGWTHFEWPLKPIPAHIRLLGRY